MKKIVLILIAVAITGFSASQVLAYHGDGRGGNCGRNMQQQNLTEEQVQAHQAFMKETAGLRQELASKVGEYRALMAGTNPDPKAAGKLAGEIAGLKNDLREKAVAAGVPFKGHGMGLGMGHGMGDGHRQGKGNCNW